MTWTGWTPELDQTLRDMRAGGFSWREVSKELGCSFSTAHERLLRLREADAEKTRKLANPSGEMVKRIQDQRRGFVLPGHLREKYFALLKQGRSIHEARKELGLGEAIAT